MTQLPLFPLSLPLFPGQRIDLQIFEQRYLSLISRCLKEDKGFGVVLIREGREVGAVPQIFQFGVEAKIVDWRQQPDGLLGISVEGARKFSVQATSVQDDQLMLAEVDWLPVEPREEIPAQFGALSSLYQQLSQHPMAAKMGMPEPRFSSELGWCLCQLLPLQPADTVALLALADPLERLQQLQERVSKLSEE